MTKSTMLYIIFCLIIAFTIGWVFIFKKFIYDKFIFLILNATKYLNENNLTINKGFLKKTFFRNAVLYTVLLAPIYIFCYSFVLYIFFNKKLTYINEIFKYISFFVCLIIPLFLPIMIPEKFIGVKLHILMWKHASRNNDKTTFFNDEIDINLENNKIFLENLNKNINIELKSKNSKIDKKYTYDQIRKYCFKKEKFQPYKLNLFLFKNPKDIYLNNKELTFNQLTILRMFLFEEFNNSKPFFN